ncbi:IS200/IS605 family element transposase accessory protein TnpB [Scytonema sp. UIC 10036]|uniref:RNA-guided endonuclease InsQ/TnpB family protein n=1 Tax=Scytonema sp. UIC 10036 TaxID=2304196 RepID=UPI0012DA21B0|nr:RNA-guided endonuclease TnpB family protein [Scytonema sp. UIC 10036]MUG95765.1 IS200/IS605 family element transposase accessory protein TnpB [Scytonema sp. UIC 10036]
MSREADKWFISFRFEASKPDLKLEDTWFFSEHSVVGVDLGVLNLATLSTGEIIEGAKSYKRFKDKLARLQWLNRHKVIGSASWKKAQLQIARLQRKIANIRKDTLHKLTTLLTKNHSVIVIEDLNVKGMMANHKLAASIADMGFYEFRRQLTYKCDLFGSKLIVADRWFPSSSPAIINFFLPVASTACLYSSYSQQSTIPGRLILCAYSSMYQIFITPP